MCSPRANPYRVLYNRHVNKANKGDGMGFYDIIKGLQGLTEEELQLINKTVVRNLKEKRNIKSAANKAMFSVGDQVKFCDRSGFCEVGTIVRIKTKKAIIDTGSIRNWDVPMGMLKKV
jgi:hypothetical protein